MKRTDRRSDCPTNYALEAIGDSWSLLIVRDLMFKGKRTYSEFADSEERISTNILAQRLKRLSAAGIIRRDGSGRSTRYSLTRKGLDLLPAMVDLILWSGRYDRKTAADPDFLKRASEHRAALLEELDAEISVAHSLDAASAT